MTLERPVDSTLVLVDDDVEDAHILLSAAKRSQFPVQLLHLRAGHELLELVRLARLPARCTVLLDLNMPEMDGFAVLERLRESPRGGLLPVVVYSTASDQVQVDRAYASGANAFITKPTTLLETADLIDVIISHWLTYVRMPSLDPRTGAEP
jgi:CheY-like chemotaxis protein